MTFPTFPGSFGVLAIMALVSEQIPGCAAKKTVPVTSLAQFNVESQPSNGTSLPDLYLSPLVPSAMSGRVQVTVEANDVANPSVTEANGHNGTHVFTDANGHNGTHVSIMSHEDNVEESPDVVTLNQTTSKRQLLATREVTSGHKVEEGKNHNIGAALVERLSETAEAGGVILSSMVDLALDRKKGRQVDKPPPPTPAPTPAPTPRYDPPPAAPAPPPPASGWEVHQRGGP
jgi:hypothetical protein